MQDAALVNLDTARHALAECKTVMEAKQIVDAAEAARVYLERTNASSETVNRATEIRLLAERQMGEFLKQMPKAPAGRPAKEIGSPSEPISETPTLADIGVTKKQSSRAQKLATIPAQEFQERVAVAKISGKLTTAKVLQTEPTPKTKDTKPIEVPEGVNPLPNLPGSMEARAHLDFYGDRILGVEPVNFNATRWKQRCDAALQFLSNEVPTHLQEKARDYLLKKAQEIFRAAAETRCDS